jgi:Tir chaperone protein (CesT) family
MFKAIECANRILGEVGTRNAIHDLALNGEGTAGIQLKSGLKLFFEYVEVSNRLYIYTPLMMIPKDGARRQALYEAMLTCNFLHLESGSGSLAIFMRTEEAVYQVGLDMATLNAARLDTALNELISRQEAVAYQLGHAKPGKGMLAQNNAPVQSTYDRLAAATRINMEKVRR